MFYSLYQLYSRELGYVIPVLLAGWSSHDPCEDPVTQLNPNEITITLILFPVRNIKATLTPLIPVSAGLFTQRCKYIKNIDQWHNTSVLHSVLFTCGTTIQGFMHYTHMFAENDKKKL